MTPTELFNATGEALFGRAWKAELADRLEVNERQIRRWANGEYEPPSGVWLDLQALIFDRRRTLDELAKEAAKALRYLA